MCTQTQGRLIDRLAALGDSPPRQVEQIPTDATFKMIVLCEDDAQAQRLRPLLEPQVAGTGAELTQALPGYLEIVPTGADKATAAAVLLKRWGLSWEDAVAIGDGSNDLPMMRAAGTSIAMGNAGDSVKAAAQHVVGSNQDDGWVEAMETFVLSRLTEKTY
jgi:hydroxymethylpyrimidine pyrophosphatase-like HAD family hydrolase